MMRERIVRAGEPVVDELRVIVDGKEQTPGQRAARLAAHPTRRTSNLMCREGDDPPMLRVTRAGLAQAIPLPRGGIDAALARFTQRLG